MKHKIYLIITLILLALIFFFWPGHPPYEFLMKTLGIESSSQGTQEQSSERDDFGCFYSCKYFPEGSKQMCEDWKSGKQVQWPPDCSMMQYGPCIQFCEFEKKNNPQASQNFSNNNSQQQYTGPTGIPESDPEAGSVYIYIADQASCESTPEICEKTGYIDSRIIRIDDMTGKNWVSFGTFGNGTNQLRDPSHLAVGPDGKIYIPDTRNKRIVRIDDMTGKNWIIYNTKSQFMEPLGVAFDSKGRIYIANSNEIIRIDDMTGKGRILFGTSGSGANQFYKLKDIAIDSMDRIYGADAGNHRIIRIDDMTGKGWITYGGTKGSGIGQFEDESNGGVLDSQVRIYIMDEHNNRIVRIDDMTGKGWIEFKGLPNDPLKEPHDITIMKNGHIYILDTYNHRVVRIDDMTGKGWIAFAPYAKLLARENKLVMEGPHGMFVTERN